MPWSRFLVVGSLAIILVVTLVPGSEPAVKQLTACIICGSRGVADAILNLVLFVPLGVGLALIGHRLPRVVIAGILLSAGIEVVQWFIPGRDPNVGDLLANGLGATVGAVAIRSPIVQLTPARSGAARRSLVTALIVLGIFAATGVLVKPYYPDTTYYGQWTPTLGHLDRYDGEVVSAAVGSVALSSNRLPNSDEVRAAFQRGDPIRIRATAGSSTRRVASLVSVYDDRQREIVLVGPHREDLVYRVRKVAAQLRFDRPHVRLWGALSNVAPGDTLDITVQPGSRSTCITLNARRECGLGFTIGHGWTLLWYAGRVPKGIEHVLRAAWIALLVFPIGLWSRRHRETYVAVVLFPLGMLLIPAFVGLLPTPPLEWGAMVVGWAAGRVGIGDSTSEI